MKAKIIIDGAEYPVPQTFTYRESGVIKRLSGVRMGELLDALQAGDTDLMIALAVVAANRAGVALDPEKLLDGDLDSMQFEVEPEDDVGPPGESAPPSAKPESATGTNESVAS